MKILSVNVGLPREVEWHGQPVTTSIFKAPVAGRIPLKTLNFDGDRQADLDVHGGPQKAVYAYPSEHYAFWKQELARRDLPFGIFGENLTTEGLLESDLNIGDRLAIGSAELVVTQPRLPCYKLGIRFGSDEMVKRFFIARRSGIYFSVAREGEVAAGDQVKIVSRDRNAVPLTEIFRLYAAKVYRASDFAAVQKLLRVPDLPVSWGDYFRERLTDSAA
jgi:MOSC domain-containing protein YiiM